MNAGATGVLTILYHFFPHYTPFEGKIKWVYPFLHPSDVLPDI
jgi:hypothetical protein